MNRKAKALLIGCGVITLLCVVLLCTDFFGLRRDARQTVAEPSAAEQRNEDAALTLVSGYAESAEKKAADEWLAFSADYDSDGSILRAAVANGGTDYGEDYTLYRVYSAELAAKLDEITEKYSLALHRSMRFCYGGDELFEAAGTGRFLPANCECVGYAYDDGSFRFDGSFPLGEKRCAYSFERQQKGCFSETLLATPGEGDETWVYTTEKGVSLLLSMGEECCCIQNERPLSYISVAVPTRAPDGSEQGITAAWLESLAESFDWSAVG